MWKRTGKCSKLQIKLRPTGKFREGRGKREGGQGKFLHHPLFKGNIEATNYYPHQKNPLISKFFLQLGWVEEIGTGIYNINKYLPHYSPGRKASFIEDVIFTTTIPIPKLNGLEMRDMKKYTMHETPHDTTHNDTLHDGTMHDEAPHDVTTQDDTTHDEAPQETTQNHIRIRKLLEICMEEKNRKELQYALGLKNREYFRKEYLKPAVEAGLIGLTIPGKPSSKKQKYRITEKGKIFLKSRIEQHK